MLFPGPFDPSRYLGGSIQRVDLATGEVIDLYRECDGRPLRAPNDLVMDGDGGFWFSDNGITDLLGARTRDVTAIYYARCDGSMIREAVFPAESPNGVGLSPDGTELIWAETQTGRVRHRRITGVGEVAHEDLFGPSDVLYSTPGSQMLDSLAVDADGWINVGTLIGAGITSVSPDGGAVEFVPTGDPITTNLCFGGPDLRTVFITASSTGRVLTGRWPRAGLRLAHQAS
jgi:gluconolactonase